MLTVFSSSSLFYTPRKACGPAICEKMRILLWVSFLSFFLSINIASLPDLNFFLALLLFSMYDVFEFDRFFDVELLLFYPV